MRRSSIIVYAFACLVALFASGMAVRETRASPLYDIDVYKIDVKKSAMGNTVFQEGEMVSINCNWSVVRNDMTKSWGSEFWNKYVAMDGNKIMESAEGIATPPGPKISKGFGWTWTAKGLGRHKASCGFSNPNPIMADSDPKNNEAVMTISVIAKKVPATAIQDSVPMKAAPATAAAFPKPKLAVTGIQTKVDPSCQKITQLLTAVVSIRNTGGPLPAGKGTVFVKETGGANFSSQGVNLPEFKTNETRIVEIPAGVIPQFAGALPGSHVIAVHLNPQDDGGKSSFDKPSSPYQFTVNIPAGLCQQRTPAAAGQRGIPPMGR